jgi:hypothetical protein
MVLPATSGLGYLTTLKDGDLVDEGMFVVPYLCIYLQIFAAGILPISEPK